MSQDAPVGVILNGKLLQTGRTHLDATTLVALAGYRPGRWRVTWREAGAPSSAAVELQGDDAVTVLAGRLFEVKARVD